FLKDPAVVFIDAQSRAGILLRFHKLANAERAVPIDAPCQLHPEFVFFPNLAGIYFASVVNVITVSLPRRAHHRLAKAEPLRVVRFVGMNVVPLRSEAHRQNVVSKVGGFTPHWSQRDMTAN